MGAHPESTLKKKNETLEAAISHLNKLDHPWLYDSQLHLPEEPEVY
jgi:hypothetical protein